MEIINRKSGSKPKENNKGTKISPSDDVNALDQTSSESAKFRLENTYIRRSKGRSKL